MTAAEKRYSASEIEITAAVFGVKYFKYFLFGRKFLLVSDHMALTYVLRNPSNSSRLLRMSLKLAEYDFDVVYRAGLKIPHADALSRNPAPLPNESCCIGAVQDSCMAKEQQEDKDFGGIVRYLKGKKDHPVTFL